MVGGGEAVVGLHQPTTTILLSILLLPSLLCAASVRREPETTKKWTIQMIGYSPVQNDDYVAVSAPAPTGYIVGFEPLANADRVHHILVYGCTEPYSEARFWSGQQTCRGGTHILYAWARNAPMLKLPANVGFAIGENSPDYNGIRHIVLQVHYAAPFAGNVRDYSGVSLIIQQEEPLNLAAVYLFASGEPIPPGLPHHQTNMSCVYDHETKIHPFAFRTHTHGMGRVVSSYYKRKGEWTEIGRRNPQWPQLFEEIRRPLTIQRGDLLGATCRFDSSKQKTVTNMGAMGKDEMCNFYMMVYWKATDTMPFNEGAFCSYKQLPAEFVDYPAQGMELLPSHPELEHHAHQSAIPFGVIEQAKVSTIGGVKLGQIAGLTFDAHKNLVVFHRGSRVWDQGTFDGYNRLVDRRPIPDDVIMYTQWTGKNATALDKLGKGKFYLPHGIYIDPTDDAIYTTDVGAHTVSKWTRQGQGVLERVWVAGEELVPGADSEHFCKPTAVTRLGDSLFVSDGYCNARVVELSLSGKFKNAFASNTKEDFVIPHDIVSTKDTHQLVVSDRQNGRVHEVRSDGSLVALFQAPKFFSNVYSTDVHDDGLFMIPGEIGMSSFGGDQLPIQVFVGREGTGLLEYSFLPQTNAFNRPHILRVCPYGEHVFVGDITEGQSVIWKFKIQKEGLNHESDASTHGLFSNPLAGASTAWSVVYFIAFASCIACAAVMVYRRAHTSQSSPIAAFNRKGFQRLGMEERLTTAMSSDESDNE